jgi:PPOX class probable F420-dependent enzyme
MDIADAVDVVRQQHHAVLATTRADGTPQMSPVGVTADEAGRLLISSRATAYKTRNLRRDPRAWVCVLPDAFYGRWIQVEGEVEIVELPDAMDLLIDYYRRISGEHPDWDEYRQAMVAEQRVMLLIRPTRAGPDVQG